MDYFPSSHGLPVEFEIDNKLGIKGPEDVAKIGIAAYNAECRAIVMRYAGEWESVRLHSLFRWAGCAFASRFAPSPLSLSRARARSFLVRFCLLRRW